MEFYSAEYLALFMEDNTELVDLLKYWLEDSPLFGINWAIRDGYPGHLLQLNKETFFEIRKFEIIGVENNKGGWHYSDPPVINKRLKSFKVKMHDPECLNKLGAMMNFIEYYKLPKIWEEFHNRRARYYSKNGKWQNE